ncbi:putative N-acetyltransferase [Planococcus antarcticus DSM 14505]|uniref:N-acetyltransferase n=1 Tax=Planococcus antarcticus DSM 14505 TaxID=1185653 RepID=A0A1C7DHJ9_9BACL|nr:GNAT family N-acetyltransferase [Planococcus antarcticus]ANU11049.1 GNAT family N-acetyltransferase [Planococcus antarcticus DSM 14505]EIM07010.1 putative N-acetyltransferase [Planococcus antarcticus DSM 14505]
MNLINVSEEMQIYQITQPFEEEARDVILKGLEERFGFIDSRYNPDLKSIIESFSRQGAVFLIGIYVGQVICTGAVSFEASGVGRIERMSVLKEHRRSGVAKRMINSLEAWSKENGYQQLVLETNNGWQSAIDLYKNRGYNLFLNDGECSYFIKELV